MKNKLITLIAIPAMLIGTASFANNEQQGRDSKRSPAKMLSQLNRVLVLTETQKIQINALILQQKENRDQGLSRREKHQAMQISLAEILTSEQISTLEGLREQRRKNRQN